MTTVMTGARDQVADVIPPARVRSLEPSRLGFEFVVGEAGEDRSVVVVGGVTLWVRVIGGHLDQDPVSVVTTHSGVGRAKPPLRLAAGYRPQVTPLHVHVEATWGIYQRMIAAY